MPQRSVEAMIAAQRRWTEGRRRQDARPAPRDIAPPGSAAPAGMQYLVVTGLLTAAQGEYTDYETDGFVGGISGHPPGDEETTLAVKVVRSAGFGLLSIADATDGIDAGDTVGYWPHVEGDWDGTVAVGVESATAFAAALL